jgi:hypothetical protein
MDMTSPPARRPAEPRWPVEALVETLARSQLNLPGQAARGIHIGGQVLVHGTHLRTVKATS